ncbi:MAG: YceI family protein [Proteobacteria bacterium]|nr:YceI family protein [Pseudomonadota bacterium]
MRWGPGVISIAAIIVAPAIAAESYTIDSAHSIPVFEFSHLGLTTQTGRFDRARGSATLDIPARKGSVSFIIDTASLNMGFGTETSGSAGYLLFQVEKYPAISFQSDKLIIRDKKVIAADGQLTLLGVTRNIRVTVSGFVCSPNPMNRKPMCVGNVSATIRRSEFGMDKYIPTISDEIKISVPIEAYKD